MTEATRGFFRDLAARKHEPLLGSVAGTLRFDLGTQGGVEHWFVRVARGDVTVSRRRSRADCVLGMDEALFDRMVTGEVNAVAAALRGRVAIEGEPALVLAFQRLFPGPPSTAGRRSAGYARRRR
jgi:putative sterol carrier protein